LLLAIAASLAAPGAVAAPTCWNAAAETVRCGTAGALPVGARLSPDQEALRRSRSSELEPIALMGLALLLGGMFALLAVLPDFERWDR
jgi:hypothetical protein